MGLGAVLVIGLLLGGCGSLSSSNRQTAKAPAFPHGGDAARLLQVGQPIIIGYADSPPPGAPEQTIRIGEDGKITLNGNLTFVAAGKTAEKLQEEIQNEYGRWGKKRLKVTVRAGGLFYYVGGEVRMPGWYPYREGLTVLRAIDAGLGFTDFASRGMIELRRAADGRKFLIDWRKAIRDPSLDLEVFPGDQIIVLSKRGL